MPNPLITEIWAAFQYKRGVSARRQFLATGFSDAESVRSASPVQKGNTLSLDGRLKADEPDISTPQGPQTYLITVDYAGASGTDNNGSDLIDTPPAYWPDFQETVEPIDRDIYGNAITNSVLDPFAQNVTRPFLDIYYNYERYESEFDGPRAIAFNYTVNNAAMTLPGFGIMPKGTGLLKIRQRDKGDAAAEAVAVSYVWRIRREGWKTRILDKGRQSFYSGGGKGALYSYNLTDKVIGDPVTDDVLLNGFGIPMTPEQYAVNKVAYAPEQKSVLPAKVEKLRDGNATYLRYEVFEEASHGSLSITP